MVPSPTVIAPFCGMPRVNSEVLRASGTVPVPVAGAAAELEEPVALLDPEPDDADAAVEPADDDEPPEADCRTLCMAADN